MTDEDQDEGQAEAELEPPTLEEIVTAWLGALLVAMLLDRPDAVVRLIQGR